MHAHTHTPSQASATYVPHTYTYNTSLTHIYKYTDHPRNVNCLQPKALFQIMFIYEFMENFKIYHIFTVNDVS